MTERPIILAESQLKAARVGKRTHLCLPAFNTPGQRVSFIGRAPNTAANPGTGLKMPSVWQQLKGGEKLWVREAVVELIDERIRSDSRSFYKADLEFGRPTIPNGRTDAAGRVNRRYKTRERRAGELPRQHSRYTLAVIDVRVFPCNEIDWAEIDAEGSVRYPTDTKGQWWHRHYGYSLPWRENPAVVGLRFKFLAESIDGIPAAPWEKPEREAGKVMDIFADARRWDVS